jgi:hypothetical protein
VPLILNSKTIISRKLKVRRNEGDEKGKGQ